ncbi:hypothetical protein HYH02_012496 [Chlamydomonas schloesseri]|uniref:Uncharacterized protein n=1 Tax=Chlamydomonas schloesseri TaxID=2026947 RepID=A0A835SY84_9CHLO|nr:hypothetical protein HYH02_012496 [Chlamydomonas schloesseri]|eukprot:KAG2433951.1 hypothetical protein HYH02_012496 [Chlamydomonas schloesseri]
MNGNASDSTPQPQPTASLPAAQARVNRGAAVRRDPAAAGAGSTAPPPTPAAACAADLVARAADYIAFTAGGGGSGAAGAEVGRQLCCENPIPAPPGGVSFALRARRAAVSAGVAEVCPDVYSKYRPLLEEEGCGEDGDDDERYPVHPLELGAMAAQGRMPPPPPMSLHAKARMAARFMAAMVAELKALRRIWQDAEAMQPVLLARMQQGGVSTSTSK